MEDKLGIRASDTATIVLQDCKVPLDNIQRREFRRRRVAASALGYSREHLVEKWMRDAKISDIYEGAQQINQLIIGAAHPGLLAP